MLWLWIALCFMCKGTCSFLILNSADSLCLEDSLTDAGVQLKRCSVDSDLQQWVWSERWFLMNVHTQRCLSGFHDQPVQTLECDGEDYLQWQCLNHKLISMNRSLELGVLRGRPALNKKGKSTRWKSLDKGDICQEKLRSRRQSETGELEDVEDTLTEEQREYLRWYYRTEDSAPWTFAMLALSLVALLLGCVFCVMGMMGNRYRHRRKIAEYKAAAAAAPSLALAKTELEELPVTAEIKEEKHSNSAQIEKNHSNSTGAVQAVNDTEVLKPGEIMVTWKDGNVSSLYSEPPQEGEDDVNVKY